MIYTVLVDILDFCNAYKKRDCHVEWQPLSLIPTEVIEYINLAKSEKAMCERFAAYSSLFISLDKIYEKKNLSLSRTNNGKPYLTEKTEKSDIEISISHSGELAVISFSRDTEIGVDIQSEIDESVSKKLEKRFFINTVLGEKKFDIELLLLEISPAGNAELKKLCNTDMIKIKKAKDNSFTEKWAACEAIMKCSGRGFGISNHINDIVDLFDICTYEINYKINKYMLSIAKSVIM